MDKLPIYRFYVPEEDDETGVSAIALVDFPAIEMDWQTFTSTPSRFTAEPIERSERKQLLAQAKSQGYISNYRGIRIGSNGDRFYINQAIIWNVVDQEGKLWGQAATFHDWQNINP